MNLNENVVNVKITIVYDNHEYQRGLKTGWGFSSLIELKDKNILFDTGNDGKTLLYNMKKLEINCEKIDIIFLSHIDDDHTGGLRQILDSSIKNVIVYLPISFPKSFKSMVKSYGVKITEVSSPTQIYNGIYSTGELETLLKIEQSLIAKTEKGLVVITGCAHPGIVNILKKVKELIEEDIYLVLGGFHLIDLGDDEIQGIARSFRELGVKKVAPCHCTGDRAIRIFEKEYQNGFIKVGVGKKIF